MDPVNANLLPKDYKLTALREVHLLFTGLCMKTQHLILTINQLNTPCDLTDYRSTMLLLENNHFVVFIWESSKKSMEWPCQKSATLNETKAILFV